MGNDITIVNAARVSFDKESEYEDIQLDRNSDRIFDLTAKYTLSEKDKKLITYLAKHNHWTPFSHVQIQMRETIPIIVARQRFKHTVGFTYNEVSRRYVDNEPDLYLPEYWRNKSETAKQGSSGIHLKSQYWDKQVETHYENCLGLYNSMINDNVAPEQARMVLPQAMFTSYYVTGSLAAWARAYKLRFEPDINQSEKTSQREIQQLAILWDTKIGSIAELNYSWNVLIG